MDVLLENPLLLTAGALLLALPLVWWLVRRPAASRAAAAADGDRLDTLAGWPPEPTRIMRPQERIAYSTLRMALPGYLILAQVPVSRFIAVPRRNSHVEWMRRIGSQCVDFLICDVTSKVIAVVEVMPPAEQVTERLKVRSERLGRTLGAAGIQVHVWNEERLPSIESARMKIVPGAPAIPSEMRQRAVFASAVPETVAAAAAPLAGGLVVADRALAEAITVPDILGEPVTLEAPFADTLPETAGAPPEFAATQPAPVDSDEPDWARGGEVIEVLEPQATWFDDMEITPELPPPAKR
jgi:hypothetical protein